MHRTHSWLTLVVMTTYNKNLAIGTRTWLTLVVITTYNKNLANEYVHDRSG